MKKLILGSIFFLLSLTVFAEGVKTPFRTSFSYFDNQSFYSCYSVESLTKKVLKIIGATDFRVQCYGGLPYQSQVSAEITYSLVVPVGKMFLLKGSESCQFSVDLIDAILKPLPVASSKRTDSCWHSQGQYEYSFNL